MSAFFYISPWLSILILIAIIVLLVYVVIWVVRAHRKQVTVGREGLVGKTAIVEVALAPKGLVSVEGEHWQAIADKDRIESEEEVIVTKVEGLTLYVAKKQ